MTDGPADGRTSCGRRRAGGRRRGLARVPAGRRRARRRTSACRARRPCTPPAQSRGPHRARATDPRCTFLYGGAASRNSTARYCTATAWPAHGYRRNPTCRSCVSTTLVLYYMGHYNRYYTGHYTGYCRGTRGYCTATAWPAHGHRGNPTCRSLLAKFSRCAAAMNTWLLHRCLSPRLAHDSRSPRPQRAVQACIHTHTHARTHRNTRVSVYLCI
jgi:hypothetical protein